MARIENGWFTEREDAWAGQAFSLKIEKILFHEKSQYQDILVFQSTSYGNVLVLDECIQITEKDEFSYQEMIAHIPLFIHPNPQNVLIIGGGDGGVLREVLKHDCVKTVTWCEIDKMVIDASSKYIPNIIGNSLSDSRVTLVIEDAGKYIKDKVNCYDVVIIDSSDPEGPASVLFTNEFFNNVKNSLTINGVMSNQGECLWLHKELIKDCLSMNRKLYPSVSYAYTSIPTYPCGQIGFMICSKMSDISKLYKPSRPIPLSMNLRYYDGDMHRSAFVLPKYFKDYFGEDLPEYHIKGSPSNSLSFLKPYIMPSLAILGAYLAVFIGVKSVVKK